MMRRFLARTGALLTTAAFTAACTGGAGTATGDRSTPARTAAASTPEVAAESVRPYTGEAPRPVAHAPVKAADSSLGRILVDADGRTLYYFAKEKDGVPGCYDDCAATWTPYLTNGAPEPGEGATPHLLGIAERDDDTTQVTYAGRALYRYVKDTEPGQVTGDAAEQFGGTWHAITPKGRRR